MTCWPGHLQSPSPRLNCGRGTNHRSCCDTSSNWRVPRCPGDAVRADLLRQNVKPALRESLDPDVAVADGVPRLPVDDPGRFGVDLQADVTFRGHVLRGLGGVLEIGHEVAVEPESNPGRFAFDAKLGLVPFPLLEQLVALRIRKDAALRPGKVDRADLAFRA